MQTNNEDTQPFSHTTESPVGVLVIHGYTGAPGSVLPQGHFFANAGFNVELPLLPGHGTVVTDMEKITYKDWTDAVENAYLKLTKRADHIFVLGLSMGGALTLHLAEKYPEIKGIILVNHIVYLQGIGTHFLWCLKHIKRFVPGISNDIKTPGVKEPAYDINPTKSSHELKKFLHNVRWALHRVTCPVLLFKSYEDHVVPVEMAEYTYRKIASDDKQFIFLNDSFHVATLDNDKDIINQVSLHFIQERTR